jgi:multidrug efflux pump subunit AcrA (membrane-fusion protein)
MISKLWRLVLLLLALFAGGYLLKERMLQKMHRPPATAKRPATENIVAPALIDSLNDVTRIPTLQSGVIKKLYVVSGQQVMKGDRLFSLDKSLVQNNVHIQEIMVDQAKIQLLIQQKKTSHNKAELARLLSLDRRAISQSDIQNKRFEVNVDKIQQRQAERQLALAEANLQQARLIAKQYSIVAPQNGIILQVNARVNEFVGNAQPILLLGDTNKVMVRVSLDERDIQRFQSNMPAYLTSNENESLQIPLTFVRLNPYIVTQEHLNYSHIQEAIYYFNRNNHPQIIAGQQLDANIPIKPKFES